MAVHGARTEMLGEISGSFAHEIKTPLTNISLPAELSMMDLIDVEKGQKRMACVGGVYSVAPFRRTAEDVLNEILRKKQQQQRPKPQNKRLRAVLTHEVDGEEVYLCIMDGWQKYNLRRNTTSMDWADIQKALVTAVGKESAFFKGGLGMWNGVVLHSHPNIVSFTNYGAASNVGASRALFCGVQAGAIAFGSPGADLRFGWNEETRDNGNRVIISTHTIWGAKKVTYNGYDFGVIAIDTAAKKP